MDIALKELIKAFADSIGLEDIAVDEKDTYNLLIDDMPVSIAGLPETQELVIWTDCGPSPLEDRERLYRILLEAMFMEQGTGKAVFSLEHETQHIIIHRMVSTVALTPEQFIEILNQFVDLLERWRRFFLGACPIMQAVEDSVSDRLDEPGKTKEADGGRIFV